MKEVLLLPGWNADHLWERCIPEPNSGCWLWLLSVNRWGYGVLRREKKDVFAHRWSWTLHRGTIPPGMLVCHKCDVPSCCNPDHLFLGTDADNNADMVRKGRNVVLKGEDSANAKLTADAVRAIREDIRFYRLIAIDYGVSETTISLIRRRLIWKHIEAPTRKRPPASLRRTARRAVRERGAHG
jgi:hypothetical protein